MSFPKYQWLNLPNPFTNQTSFGWKRVVRMPLPSQLPTYFLFPSYSFSSHFLIASINQINNIHTHWYKLVVSIEYNGCEGVNIFSLHNQLPNPLLIVKTILNGVLSLFPISFRIIKIRWRLCIFPRRGKWVFF